uniref:Uncharacterized protein n=1 Tax=Proboscia inermis TaxID=420281 RepID=A0A7S0CDN5_9STRA|mmetsp:Transcript_42372/g.42946  ORF Transcript_42372/g.42946 Transcript_42372/m.42946 type:complete len:137 (+) Transcript_42372:185-595(+)
MTVCLYRDYEEDASDYLTEDDLSLISDGDMKDVTLPLTTFEYDEDDVNANYWPCEIHDRQNNNTSGDVYTIRLLLRLDTSSTWWSELDVPLFINEFPRSFIMFVNKPGKSDQFLRDAFRQPIFMHDDIFPVQWRNL